MEPTMKEALESALDAVTACPQTPIQFVATGGRYSLDIEPALVVPVESLEIETQRQMYLIHNQKDIPNYLALEDIEDDDLWLKLIMELKENCVNVGNTLTFFKY